MWKVPRHDLGKPVKSLNDIPSGEARRVFQGIMEVPGITRIYSQLSVIRRKVLLRSLRQRIKDTICH